MRSGIYLKLENKDHINRDYYERAICIAPNFIKENFEKIKDNFYKFSVNLHQEQEPSKINYISLDNKTDPNGVPLVKIYWKMSELLKKTSAVDLMLLSDFLIDNEIGRISDGH